MADNNQAIKNANELTEQLKKGGVEATACDHTVVIKAKTPENVKKALGDAVVEKDDNNVKIATSSITNRGMKEKDMEHIAHYLIDSIKHANDNEKLKEAEYKIGEFFSNFPL